MKFRYVDRFQIDNDYVTVLAVKAKETGVCVNCYKLYWKRNREFPEFADWRFLDARDYADVDEKPCKIEKHGKYWR